MKTISEIVRKAETDFVSGTTKISEHVEHSMHDTLSQIDAYHSSKHISGETDSLGREKPFFNITIANTNVWYRATDIDRSWIKIRGTKSSDWLNSMLATIKLQEWMKTARFGSFLNEWGRVLAKYGSAVVKFVESDGELSIQVIPWNRLIVDSVNFAPNPRVEILELTEAELRGRVETHGYDLQEVENLTSALTARETVRGERKDDKNDYIKLYEVHGNLSKQHLTGDNEDTNTFVQQMHVVSFVGKAKGRKTEFQDFTLFSGKEEKDPYEITHLIKEDGRTLAIGSVEHLFQAQWQVNHSNKATKDQLDLATKTLFQTPDPTFLGRNVLSNIETGDILIHAPNQPLTQVNNQALNLTSQENYAVKWKQLGNEITGVSEAMLGATPKSGTAWRQTEAILQESRNLFELMTENKGLHIEDMLREWIIPHLKTKLDTSEEVTATLDQYDIDRIDERYIKAEALRLTDDTLKEKVLEGESILEGEQDELLEQNVANISDSLRQQGNRRSFVPSKLSDKTWKKQFENFEWETEIDITGESRNVQESMTTLSTALQVSMNPAFAQNKKAQVIVGKILEMSGTMSPVEYNSIPEDAVQTPPAEVPDLQINQQQQ